MRLLPLLKLTIFVEQINYLKTVVKQHKIKSHEKINRVIHSLNLRVKFIRR